MSGLQRSAGLHGRLAEASVQPGWPVALPLTHVMPSEMIHPYLPSYAPARTVTFACEASYVTGQTASQNSEGDAGPG
jgi:hypothetical protein